MGRLHFKICRSMKEIDVVAVADRSAAALRYAKSSGVANSYHDYAELFSKEDLDAAIIALPNAMHTDCILSAARMGIHTFVEKPLAEDTQQCEQIKHAVQSNGIKLMVGHNFRFYDCVLKIKKLVEEGVLGDIKLATFEFVINGPFSASILPSHIPEWYFMKDQLSMGIMDSGYHLVDIQRWFFEPEPRILLSRFSAVYNLPYKDSATIVSESGETRCVTNIGWFCRAPNPLAYNFRVILHGTAGFVTTDELTPNRYAHAIKEGSKNLLRKLVKKRVRPLEYTYWQSSYYRELAAFFDCIRTDQRPPVTVDDALKVTQTIKQIMSKSSEGDAYVGS
jgi:predicted dehydrogenase